MMIEDMNGRWYVVALIKHRPGLDPIFKVVTMSNLEGFGSHGAARTAVDKLADIDFPCAIVYIEDTFDRVKPEPDPKLVTKKAPINPWDVL